MEKKISSEITGIPPSEVRRLPLSGFGGLLAKIVSAILHPLLMPTFTYLLLIYLAPGMLNLDAGQRLQLLLPVFVATFIIPLLCILMLYSFRIFSPAVTGEPFAQTFRRSLNLESREERIIPFSITTGIYGLLTYFVLFRGGSALYVLGVSFGGITLCLAWVSFISGFWKISAHSTGIWGTVGFLTALYLKRGEILLFYPILILLGLAGLLMSSRLYLNLHTPAQVVAGGLLGLGICLATGYFFV
jgi:membrane-associated phospholipid phosphatase